jgi:hypothetical protein
LTIDGGFHVCYCSWLIKLTMNVAFGVPIIAILSFIIGNNNILIAHLQAKVAKLDIVRTFLTNKLSNRPGKGHMANGGIPRAEIISLVVTDCCQF